MTALKIVPKATILWSSFRSMVTMAAGLGEVGPSFTLLNVALCVWILQNCQKKKKKNHQILCTESTSCAGGWTPLK